MHRLTLILALLGAPALASADEARLAREGRSGATFGVSLGGGHLGCSTDDGDDCDGDGPNGALYLAFRGGFTVAPRAAIIGDLWGTVHRDDRTTVSQGILAGAIRFWPADRFWLQGGVGVARSAVNYDADVVEFESRSDVVPAVIGGLGFELVSTRDFALDLEFRGGTGMYKNDVLIYTLGAGLGVSWY